MSNIVEEIMLIDDDRATNVFSKYLINKKACCHNLTIHDCALKAFKDLKNRAENKLASPDIIFLDLNMPKMNGWEFLEEYISHILPSSNIQTNLYILSTSMNPEDEKRGEGIDCVVKFLKKPMNNEMLDEVLGNFDLVEN